MDAGRPLPFSELVQLRLSRRGVLQTLGAATATLTFRGARAAPTVGFAEVSHAIDERLHLPPGYRATVLARWGDPVLPGAPEWVPGHRDADAQEKQFGFNCDFLAYVPLSGPEHGLLCVNHEYTNHELMWPAVKKRDPLDAERTAVEMAAHGHSVLEIRRRDGRWSVVEGSRYARRLSTRSTRVALSGPAAGHPRLRTSADPSGREVVGVVANCAGGVTPWGTVLSCEENVHKYFGGDPERTSEARNLREMGVGVPKQPKYKWHLHHPRFDVEREPHEANRFGWVVEYDPKDPGSKPVKRTALGRRWHECATCVVDAGGRLVVYGGDDAVFQHLYRFVSDEPVAKGGDLLDRGTLYAARLDADGGLRWLPLVFGQGPLTPTYDFHSQADVLIECRRAAHMVGATPMDRPEDIEVDPVTGRVYVMLTENAQRTAALVDAANPRGPNPCGHVLEISPRRDAGGVHHAAPDARWDALLSGGPRDAGGFLANPDNAAFDPSGRLWIATDGGPGSAKIADGLWHCTLDGPERGRVRRLLALPAGAECCGPCFSPDGRTLFVSVQHPGEGSTWDAPSTRWPDFEPQTPPRPSVVAITRDDGKPIGG